VLRFVRAAAVAVAVLGVVAPAALAHQGNPNFRSEVRAIVPAIDGLRVDVVNYDDSLELTNRSGRTVVVGGYRGEPYVRIDGAGRVEVNLRSPSYYLNDQRFTDGVKVPASASSRAVPQWRTVDRTGRYVWHDHRIHWMAQALPPQVKDQHQRTTVFDWRVPLTVAGRPGAIRGTLIWVGKQDAGFPVAAALSLAVAMLAGLTLIVVVRRRRRVPTARPEAW
jgi:predicted Rdx family selenoprotein